MGCDGRAPPCAQGWEERSATARPLWIVVVRHHLAKRWYCLSAALSEAKEPNGVIRRLTTIAAKTDGLPNNTTGDMLRVQSLRGVCTEIIRSGPVYACYDRR